MLKEYLEPEITVQEIAVSHCISLSEDNEIDYNDF